MFPSTQSMPTTTISAKFSYKIQAYILLQEGRRIVVVRHSSASLSIDAMTFYRCNLLENKRHLSDKLVA